MLKVYKKKKKKVIDKRKKAAKNIRKMIDEEKEWNLCE